MLKEWESLTASPEFQSLPEPDKESRRAQFFDEKVAPKYSQDPGMLMRAKWAYDRQTAPKPAETQETLIPEKGRGFLGHAKDLGLSVAKSAIAVPELAVGLADIPTGGAVGKALENKDGMIGFRPKQAKDFLSQYHTDQYKASQQEFDQAEGVLDKAGVALTNPAMLANTVAESAFPMLAGGAAARGVLAAAPALSGYAAGAIGEGAVMAGSQAENIRQQTEDGLLTPGQSGAALATGALGTVFGYFGGQLAKKFGVGDIDEMMARGIGQKAVAQVVANTKPKSVPRQVIEGAITEGFLEELPQSVSEQIIQNLALNKDWSEGVDGAAVMGTLAGMVMGSGASAVNAMGRKQDEAVTEAAAVESGDTKPKDVVSRLIDNNVIAGATSEPVDGVFTPEQSLARLLQDPTANPGQRMQAAKVMAAEYQKTSPAVAGAFLNYANQRILTKKPFLEEGQSFYDQIKPVDRHKVDQEVKGKAAEILALPDPKNMGNVPIPVPPVNNSQIAGAESFFGSGFDSPAPYSPRAEDMTLSNLTNMVKASSDRLKSAIASGDTAAQAKYKFELQSALSAQDRVKQGKAEQAQKELDEKRQEYAKTFLNQPEAVEDGELSGLQPSQEQAAVSQESAVAETDVGNSGNQAAMGGGTEPVTVQEASLPEVGGQEPGAVADSPQPAAIWTGKAGDGYPSAEAAQAGLRNRQKAEPSLQWTVEQMPSGRFQVAGYGQPESSVSQSDENDTQQDLSVAGETQVAEQSSVADASMASQPEAVASPMANQEPRADAGLEAVPLAPMASQTVDMASQASPPDIRLKSNGTPFKTEKEASISGIFRKTPGAEVVPVAGGFGVSVQAKTQDSQAKVAPPADKPSVEPQSSVKPRKPSSAAKAAESARADYFTPGNIVKGYGGHDQVIEYIPPDETGRWTTKVRAVVNKDGKWVPDPRDNRIRTHSTQPDKNELAKGPVVRAQPDTNKPKSPNLAQAEAEVKDVGPSPKRSEKAKAGDRDAARQAFQQKFTDAYGNRPEKTPAKTARSEKVTDDDLGEQDLSRDEAKSFAKMTDDDISEYNKKILSEKTILNTPRKSYIAQMVNANGIRKGSPGYDTAIEKVEQDYETELDKAHANLTFEQYNELNKKTPESLNRKVYDQLQEEYGADQQLSGQDVLFSKADKGQTLYVAHNLTESNLFHVDELGAIAAPSLAVASVDHGFSPFGEITLLADPTILESKKVKAFDADVYTPRHPQAVYTINRRRYDAFADKSKNEFDLSPVAMDDFEQKGAEALLYSPSAKLAYLKSIGKDIKPKKAKASILTRRIAAMPGSRWDKQDNPEVIKAVESYWKKESERIVAMFLEYGEPESAIKRYMRETFNEDGTIKDRLVDQAVREAERYTKSNGYSRVDVEKEIDKQFRTKKATTAYEEWARSEFNAMVDGAKIFKGYSYSGNRRYVEYTLDNIIKEMTAELQGGESWNYGAGTIRSTKATQLKNVKQVQANRDRIVSDKEFETLKAESNNKLVDLLEYLKPYYRFDATSALYSNDASSAMAEGNKGIREAFNLDAEAQARVNEFFDYLRNMPTSYFEAKAQRAVDLSEFKIAVVPKGTSQKAIDILKAKGLDVKYYKAGDEQSRLQVIAAQDDVLFSKDSNGVKNPHTTATLRAAMDKAFPKVRQALENGGLLRVITADQIPAIIRDGKFSKHRAALTNVRGGWTKEKIRKELKAMGNSNSSGRIIQRQIAEFDSAEEFAENIFYHGTGGYVEGKLKPSIVMSEREAERSGGGGYGQRYWAASVSKSKNVASNFTGMSRTGTLYPVVLKKGATVISMPEIKDAIELEDIIEDLWNRGVDAVKIGDWSNEFSEQELAILNPKAAFKYTVSESYPVFNKKKFDNLLPDQIKAIYDKAKDDVKTLDAARSLPKAERDAIISSIEDIKFSKDGRIQGYVANGVVTMVADNISQSANVKGLMMHEIGVHLMKMNRSDAEFQKLQKQFEAMAKMKGSKAEAAMKRVPEDTPEHLRLEEAVGYFCEVNTETTFAKKFIAWIKSKLREWLGGIKGADKLKAMQWASQLSNDDLVYLAQAAVRSAKDARNVRARGDMLSSKADSFTESDYRPAVVSWAKERFGNQVAPNGNPAWQNFVEWFSDSKVTNPDGTPMVVYHGSWTDTGGVFSAEMLGTNTTAASAKQGFFFASNPETASSPYYATMSLDALDDASKARTGKSYIVDLADRIDDINGRITALDNAFDPDEITDSAWQEIVDSDAQIDAPPTQGQRRALSGSNNQGVKDYLQYWDDMVSLDMEKKSLKFEYESYLSAKDKFDYKVYGGDDVSAPRMDSGLSAANVTSAYLSLKNPYIHDYQGAPWRDESYAEVIEKAKSAGNDGVALRNTYDGGKEITDIYIAFLPDQIKSSTGNTGNFSPQSPDIRYSVGRDEETLATVADRVLAKPERKTVIGKIRQAIDAHRDDWQVWAKQGILDQFASIADLETKVKGALLDASESAYKAAAFSKNSNTVLETAMHFGAVRYVNGGIELVEKSKGLMQILEPLADGDLLREWELWAGAVRAKRLLQEGKEKNYTAKDVAFVLSNVYGDKLELFKNVHKDWIAYNKSTLDFAESAGLINAEQRAQWEKDDYVPFHRVSEFDNEDAQTGPNRKGGIAGQKSGINQLTGGVEKISIVEAMVRNTAHMIDASMKNVAMQRTIKLAKELGVVEEVKDAKISVEEAKQRLEAMGIEYDEDSIKTWASLLEKHDARIGTVTVSENGKTKRYIVHDPMLLRAMSSLGPTGVEGIMKVLRIPKRLLTEMITADPSFALRNFVRDSLSTWVTVHEGKRNPLTGAIRGVVKSYQNSEEQMAMMAQGVGGGGFYDTSPEGARAHLDKLAGKGKTITSVGELWKAYRKVLGTTENANRIAIYEAAIKRGATKAEAAYQAMDVLNFSRHGEFKAVRLLIELVPFMSARLNGLERLYRGMKEGTTEWHQFNRSFMIKGAMLTAATLALLASNWDEDDYWDLEEWERDTYYHIFVGGEHYRIPKPFEVGAVFSTIPERMFEQMRDDANTKLLGSRMLHMIADTFALDPTPQFVKPALEVSQNRSSFTGREILSMGMKFAAPEAQYSPYTSKTMIEIADAMPDSAPEWMRSPARLEHLFRGYFGTLGGYVLMGSDYASRQVTGSPVRPELRVRDVPIINSFVRDGVGTNKQVGRVYDMATAVGKVNSAIKKYKDEGLIDKAKDLQLDNQAKLKARIELNRATRKMSEISSKMKRIYDHPAMTPAAKRLELDKLIEQRNVTAKTISEKYYDLF